MDGAVAEQFERYYREHGFKKSTPIARLNREHLGREGFPAQPGLFTFSNAVLAQFGL